jgi:hypothetical protein
VRSELSFSLRVELAAGIARVKSAKSIGDGSRGADASATDVSTAMPWARAVEAVHFGQKAALSVMSAAPDTGRMHLAGLSIGHFKRVSKV